MSEKEYLKRDIVKEEEKTWCKIDSEGKLQYLDWEFIAQQASQFDQVGDAGVRDHIMTTCKLITLVREQTLEKVGVLIERFTDSRNDASALVFYDPTQIKIEPSIFVFMHVGDDVSLVVKLVDSIKKTNPDSRIIMCTDLNTPQVEGVERREFNIDRAYLMPERWRVFAELNLSEPAIYMDSDMIVRGAIDAKRILGDKDYVFCKRSFNKEAIFNTRQRGLYFSEYEGRTIGDIYPILACFIIARSGAFFEPLHGACLALPSKFKIWYGDQEVLRDFKGKIDFVDESRFACLPEYLGQHAPFIVHYKGNRKNAAP